MDCECGCGQPTNPKNPKARFVAQHHLTTAMHRALLATQQRAAALKRKPATTGLCECGCGQNTNRPTRSFRHYRFLTGHNSRGMKRGEGRYVNNFGYVMLRMPDDPSAQKGYVREHRYVMEQSLGRRLTRSEHVHHINGDKADNRPSNLTLLTHSDHAHLHLSKPRGPWVLKRRLEMAERMRRIWAERRSGLRPMPKH